MKAPNPRREDSGLLGDSGLVQVVHYLLWLEVFVPAVAFDLLCGRAGDPAVHYVRRPELHGLLFHTLFPSSGRRSLAVVGDADVGAGIRSRKPLAALVAVLIVGLREPL
jgi:hypothetical protein